MEKVMKEITLSKKKIADCEAGAEHPPAGTKKMQRKRARIAKAVKDYYKHLHNEEEGRDDGSESAHQNDMDDDSDEDDDDSGTPMRGEASQAESIQQNPQMRLLNLIAMNSKLTKK